MNLCLPAHQPFSFHSVVHSHGWVQLAPCRYDEVSQTLAYTARLGSGKVVDLAISAAPDGVSVQAGKGFNQVEQAEVRQMVSWMLGLDQDFSSFYALASREPKLAQAAARAQGRILRSPTLFEDVVKTILTTNTLWAATIRMNKNLVEQFGSPLPSDPERKAFPAPEQLAGAEEETLSTQTRLGYRAPYIDELSRRVASGELDLEALKDSRLPTPELRRQLLDLKGVGDYAAANLLMILGRYDAIPVDSWATKMVSNEWYGGAPVGRAQVEAAFEHWGEWKGLAYWLWDWNPVSSPG
jgi:3-methyladenine DNA glycosylase/8-oxoguanine DNA glycosylase